MNLFDQLVTEAIKHQPQLHSLRIVVEKELLHHDILRILSHNNLLKDLAFIGGTCLRCCYGGIRLSEDLDFTGGREFSRETLSTMGEVLMESLSEKYGLVVQVSEPIKEIKNVNTWKIKVQTRPEQKFSPAQRINIDICSVSSYEISPMMLLNPYGVDMGTGGLIVQVQSREEIYTDKLLAFALRPNRLKYRDLWDMVWLHQRGIKPNVLLILNKLKERETAHEYFLRQFAERQNLLIERKEMAEEFKQEMRRFLPIDEMKRIVEQEGFWEFIIFLIRDLSEQIRKSIQ